MKIVVAPDKFKGCLPAILVADAMAEGVRRACPQATIMNCPVADGGEGFVQALVDATGGRFISRQVTGPRPDMRVEATFGLLGDGETAVIEMAAASGLALLPPDQRDPMLTTTFGTGELLNAAIEAGARTILLGIGGSATVDGGIGCAQATGHTIVLQDGEPVSPTEPLVGQDLHRVVLVKRHRGERTDGVKIIVACDVSNPLFGPTGAAEIFGPQKGATPAQVQWLDETLRELARRTGKLAEASTQGAGAAGGLGFGLMAFFGAELRPGAQIVLTATGLREKLAGADLCLTGEGRLDSSSLHGKAAVAVASLCRELAIPCIAIAGSIGSDFSLADANSIGLCGALSICDRPMSLAEALADAPRLIASAAANAVAIFQSSGRPQ